ncbi:hypothetical protein CI109_102201 [Kwoniella shandongensis]|uniref:Uncharacterized protein n=1 Tax=Kwoniella shandongensis TaxID=1734106 RepID=A0AAJ8LI78_9TREE
MPSLPDTTHTAFRLTEKHFKNRSVKGQLPSLHEYQHNLVDLSRPDRPEHDEVWRAGWWSTNKSRKGKERDLGERPDLALQQPITLHDGRYTLPPNPLSLSTHYLLPPDLFHLYATEPDTLILPKHSLSPVSSTPLPPKSRTIVDTEPAAVLGYDEIVARNKTWTGDVPSDKLGAKSAQQLMREVRWANLGWVYQPPTLASSTSTNSTTPSWATSIDQSVPRIMEGTLPEHFQPHDDDDDTIRAAKQWISSARININARQVFPPGFQRPST